MDFMTRELRTAFGTPVVANNTISFDRVEDTGYSSGGNTPTTLNAVGKNWQGSMFKFSENAPYTVRIIAGTGAGQARTIEQNTSNQLTISSVWGVTPDASSFYIVTINKGFTRNPPSDNILKYRIGARGNNNPPAENITSLSFTLPTPDTITVTLIARTRVINQITKQYRFYTITEDVRTRN